MVIPLPKGKSIGKPITKLCIIAAQDQPLCPAPLPEDKPLRESGKSFISPIGSKARIKQALLAFKAVPAISPVK